MSFFEFPHTRTYDSDLGWLIAAMKKLADETHSFIETNKIKFADPIIWDITKNYESNTIVMSDDGNGYISSQAVPAGIALTNTSYWTQLFNFGQLLSVLRHQIVTLDDGDNINATADRNINELIWLNDQLYIVTQFIAIGNTYIENVNIKHVTVEDIINSVNNKIDTIHTTFKTLGCVDDGVTDNSEILANALSMITTQKNIYVDGDVYNFSSNIEIPSNIILIFEGGRLKTSDSGLIDIKGEIIAPLYQIFDIDISININHLKNKVGHPEYFGYNSDWALAINKTIETFYICELQARDYDTRTTIYLKTTNNELYGVAGYFSSNEKMASRIIYYGSASGVWLGAIEQPASRNNFPRYLKLHDVIIWSQDQTGTSKAMSIRWSIGAKVNNISCNESFTGVYINGAVTPVIENVSTFNTLSFEKYTSAREVFGIEIDGSGNIGLVTGNGSVYIKNCHSSIGNADASKKSTGLYMHNGSSDTFIDSFETSNCNIGVFYVSSVSEEDVWINKLILDQCHSRAITLRLNKDVINSVHISNSYLNIASDATSLPAFDIQNAQGLYLNDIQILGTNETGSRAMGGSLYNCVFKNIQVIKTLTPVYFSNIDNCDIDIALVTTASTSWGAQLGNISYSNLSVSNKCLEDGAYRDGVLRIFTNAVNSTINLSKITKGNVSISGNVATFKDDYFNTTWDSLKLIGPYTRNI